MNEVSFREKIVALRTTFLADRLNYNRSEDFWHVMDSISDELVLKWADRASKIKNPIDEPWIPSEWTQLCNILNYMKNLDRMTQSPWTKKQKRFCTFMIIKFWDDLDMIYCF